MISADRSKYAVSIQTPAGPALFESVDKWNLAEFVGAYIATSRRYKTGTSNKVPVSAFFTNSPDDAKVGILRPNTATQV
jgi:hypothetical protein